MSRNRTSFLIFGGFITAIAAALYPIFIHPLTHTDDYKQDQKANRAGINQSDVQPVGVKMWSDPFKTSSK